MITALDIVVREARAHRTVLIESRNGHPHLTADEVEAYSLRPGQNGLRLMFFCLTLRRWRSVAVGDLVAARTTGRRFEPRYQLDL